MNDPRSDDPRADGVIRITQEEANSSHVDDLLKRQMSLRGEPGVTRDRGRRWYYQNWLIFSLSGLLGSVLAWAILEPYFDDSQYLQGEITQLDTVDFLPNGVGGRDSPNEVNPANRGSMVINGQKIYFLTGAKEIKSDGSKPRYDPKTFKAGETVGVYVEYAKGRDFDLAVGEFVVRSPPPLSAERAKMTLDQLSARTQAAGMLLFPLVAGLIGLCIGAVDGLVCRLPRRALLSGLVGLLVGFVGGFVSSILANIAYAPLNQLAMKQASESIGSLSTFGFVIQMLGRSLAWCLAGMAMGLGQGIALRSKRLLIYGLLGGVVGGLLGGLLFDPIDLLLLGPDKPSAHWSRLIGFGVIGLSVGAMVGVVELLARDAWLRMTQGPLTGKEFLLFKDLMNIGSSPRSDIYLFNDPAVAEHHAVIRAVGDECEIEARQNTHPVQVNNRAVQRGRLRHGDNVTIGRTAFVFQRRKG
jgi:hypothetical protein